MYAKDHTFSTPPPSPAALNFGKSRGGEVSDGLITVFLRESFKCSKNLVQNWPRRDPYWSDVGIHPGEQSSNLILKFYRDCFFAGYEPAEN